MPASVSTCGVSENSLPSVATKPPRSSVNRMRRAVARGSSAARARSLSVIGPLVVAEHLQQPQAAVEALDEIGGALLAVFAFQFWHLWSNGRWPVKIGLAAIQDMS